MTPEGRSSGSAGWRSATACSCTGRRTGRPPCARAAATSRPRPAASRGCTRSTRVPGVRGVARLAEAFAVIPLVKRALPEARLPFQDAGVLAVAAGASVGGTLLRRHVRGAGGEAAAAPSRSCPRCSRCAAATSPRTTASSTRRSAPTRPTRTTPRDAAKEHDRCGSHLVAPMLAANLAGTLLLRRAVERPGPLAGGAVALASTAAAVEVFALVRAPRRLALARALKRPGFEIQRARRHARAGRAPARGRARRARRDPARGGGGCARTSANGVQDPTV